MGSSRWVAVLKLYSPVLNIALHEDEKDIIISTAITVNLLSEKDFLFTSITGYSRGYNEFILMIFVHNLIPQ